MLNVVKEDNKDNNIPLKSDEVMIIIIDSCFFSRIACEEIIDCIADKMSVFSFECFTDYKMWSETTITSPQKKNIIFNAASGPFYDRDAIEFLTYEKAREDVSGKAANILFFVSKNRPQFYHNAIITHYMIKHDPTLSLRVISNFLELSVTAVKDIMNLFIHDGKAMGTLASEKADKRPRHFTKQDIRALNILLSGVKISKASSDYSVAQKTLYTQRTGLLNKLAI